jgi:hypothetical protein
LNDSRYDKPLHKRPERGKPPIYITQEDALNLGTSSRFRYALEALKQHKPSAAGAVRDYFETFAEGFEKLRITSAPGADIDDSVIESIESFLPYRDQFIELISVVARYRPENDIIDAVHSLFEQLFPYLFRPPNCNQWQEWDFDNYKFITQELYIYTTAILVKHGRFGSVN